MDNFCLFLWIYIKNKTGAQDSIFMLSWRKVISLALRRFCTPLAYSVVCAHRSCYWLWLHSWSRAVRNALFKHGQLKSNNFNTLYLKYTWIIKLLDTHAIHIYICMFVYICINTLYPYGCTLGLNQTGEHQSMLLSLPRHRVEKDTMSSHWTHCRLTKLLVQC